MSQNSITKEVVHKIADLSKLKLNESEEKEFATQLNAIFEHFEKLSKVDTKNIEPLVTPSPITQHLRNDVVEKGLGSEKSLQNAPEKQGYLFKVPPVI